MDDFEDSIINREFQTCKKLERRDLMYIRHIHKVHKNLKKKANGHFRCISEHPIAQ